MAEGKRTADGILAEYEYIGCRLRRHQWKESDVFLRKDGRQKFIVFRFECLSCGCVRTDVYDRNGELDDRYYKHAPGYLLHYSAEEREEGLRVGTRQTASFLVRRALREGVPEEPNG